jgi:hypothetical protein
MELRGVRVAASTSTDVMRNFVVDCAVEHYSGVHVDASLNHLDRSDTLSNCMRATDCHVIDDALRGA